MDGHDLLPIPHIETATEPVHSPADLRQRWRALMGPLGFGERLLWFGFVGPDRRFTKVLSHMAVGPRPQSRQVKALMTGLAVLLASDNPPGTTVALLLTRPGTGGISAGDRVWAKQLTTMAARLEVSLEPIFRANDEVVLPVGAS